MPQKREPLINFRVTECEARSFRDAADALDLSLSDFIRRAAKLGAAQLALCPELRALELDYVPTAEQKQ